jgi:hypothetical protein
MKKQKKISEAIVEKNERFAEQYYKKYKPFMQKMEKSALSVATSLQPHHYTQLGRMLKTTEKYIAMKESDGSIADLGLVPQVALDVVTANFTSSILNIVCSTQQLPDQTGIIYFEQTRATTTRGNVTAGQTLLSPFKAPDVYAEGFAGASLTAKLGDTTSTGKTYTFAAAFAKVPVRPRSVLIEINIDANTTVYAQDIEGDGKLHGNGALGTIDYETGDVTLSLAAATGAVLPIKGRYSTDIEESGNLSTINVDLSTQKIDAQIYALQAQIGLFKQYTMNKRLGLNAKDRLTQKLTEAMANELVNQAISLIQANATGLTQWDRTPAAGTAWYLHKQELADIMTLAEQKIFDNAGRGGITAFVCSSKGASLIKMMPGFVKASIPVGAGATLYGTFEGVPVIRCPQIDDKSNTSAFPNGVIYPLYKGDLPYDAALVYGSFMPLVSIKDVPVSTNITLEKQGVATWGGFACVAPNFITAIKINKSADGTGASDL